MLRPARDGEAVDDMYEAGVEPAEPDNPRPSARIAWMRCRQWYGKGTRRCRRLLYAARAGGNRTRVSTSSPHTLRPSSGIGIVRQRLALCCSAELRNPVARGLAHARPNFEQTLEEPARIELAT